MRLHRIAIALALLALASCETKYEAHKLGGAHQDGSKQAGNRPQSAKKEQLSEVSGPTVRSAPVRAAPGFNVDGKPQRRNAGPNANAQKSPNPNAGPNPKAQGTRIDPITGMPRKRATAPTDPYGATPNKKPAGAKKKQRPPPPDPYATPPR